MEVKLTLNERGRGKFYIEENGEDEGEMEIAKTSNELIVYHTEVLKEKEGKGLAKILLTHMVNYARANHLTVVPLCPYVYSQFKRHPELYSDVWDGKIK
jgi:uncharacterized protein